MNRFLMHRMTPFSVPTVFLAGCIAALAASGVSADTAKQSDSSVSVDGQDRECLAMNIYHEGRGESYRGQEAIAAVTMNRVQSRHFPDTVCEVVWQHKQFSWTRTAPIHHAIVNVRAWKQALDIAERFLSGGGGELVGKANHYHAEHVKPYWIRDDRLIARIGKHFFYVL